MKKSVKCFLTGLLATILIFVAVLEIFSQGATKIFNEAMQEQDMLKGTITVEKIQADIFGEVTFKNLVWEHERGGTILEIPEGSFKVDILDILTQKFQSTTIKELYLTGAIVSITLDENMNVDFIRHSKDLQNVSQDMKTDKESWEEKVSRVNKTEEELKEIGERRRRIQQLKIENGWKNFNAEGRKIDLNLKLDDCQFEIFYGERHYLMRGVHFETKVNTDKEMTLNAYTGTFGGTMIGRGVSIQGNIDFKSEKVPQCNLLVTLREIDPSSLGLGMNVHDKMTLMARFTGPVSQPVGKGKVEMAELHLPGIDFTNVEGKIHYEDSTLNFVDVTADVYDGKLDAHGDYNIDTRYYNIYGHGSDLKAYTALPNAHLHCDVILNIVIQSKGNAKETVTSGDFVSGEGRYSVVAFDKISGKFRNEYKDLSFYDVEIDISSYKIATDALSIKDGKLTFAPITLTNASGEVVRTYEQ